MADDLRSTIEAAVSTPVEETHVEPVQADSSVPDSSPDAPAPSSEAGAVEPIGTSGPDKQTTDAKPSIEDVAGTPDKPVEHETPAQKEARQRVDRAPQSWKGEAKKVWETLPLQVRQEVARREREIMPVMQQAAQDRQRVQQIVDVMTPHRERIQNMYGGNPVTAINNLLQAEQVLTTAPMQQRAQFVARMIQQYGVDIRALDAALVGEPIPEQIQQQSTIEQLLEQKLAPFQQFIQTQQQREQQVRQQTEQQVVGTVQEMANDPKYPYFSDVREDMADIIELGARKGVYISLPEAYNKAVRMNDDVFQATSVRDSTQGATQAALDAHRAAQAAKGASVSVSGSPTGTGRNLGNPSDLRGTIEAQFGGGRL
jgi:hypothetical protein